MKHVVIVAAALLSFIGAAQAATTQTMIVVDADRTFEIEVESMQMLSDGSLQVNVAPHYTEMLKVDYRPSSNMFVLDSALLEAVDCTWTSWSMDANGTITLHTDPNDPPCGDPAYNWPTFRDVYSFHWASDAIETLAASGITTGCDANHFCPNAPMTRAQMAVFLERGIRGGDFIPEPATGMFDDVPASYWAAAWVEQLALDGITYGCGNYIFCPDNNVTRAEMAPLLLRSSHYYDDPPYTPEAATGTIFADVPADYWAADWIEALHAEQITSGCNDGTIYCPDNNLSRAEMAVFLTRAFGL